MKKKKPSAIPLNKANQIKAFDFNFIDELNNKYLNLEFLDTFEITEIEILPFAVLNLEPTEEQKKKQLYERTRALKRVKKV